VIAAVALPGALLAAPPAPGQRLPAVEADLYERCMALARSEPEAARETARRWRLDGGGHPADHCEAVALLGLGQEAEAARRLEALADRMRASPPELRAAVLGHAGQAWLLAGEAARAHEVLSQALALRPDDLDLRTDRAAAAGALGRPADALSDLDRVLAQQPNRVDALTFRASARRAMRQLEPALADVERALALAPDAPDALLERGNIRRLAGDTEGARQDWQRVIRLAPGTEASAAAATNLARLDG
jgi:tetratricopeptide (TPR) repeat protein